jgi:predicted  nucleic acid-binding Zn-ribbon protein
MASPKEISRLQSRLESVERRLKSIQKQLAEEKKKTRSLEGKLETRIRREGIVMDAIGITSRTKKGDRGLMGELNGAVLRLEEYLLRTSERIDNILSALKSHRGFLVKMNQRLNQTGSRERMVLELDIMRNTLWILGMNGVRIDIALVKDIETLRADAEQDSAQVSDLRERKDSLDRKFDDELKRVDLGKISHRTRDIPGYI